MRFIYLHSLDIQSFTFSTVLPKTIKCIVNTTAIPENCQTREPLNPKTAPVC